jgi:hypothetical protein
MIYLPHTSDAPERLRRLRDGSVQRERKMEKRGEANAVGHAQKPAKAWPATVLTFT